MVPEALDSGDFSLTLREPQVSDSGVYICSMIDDEGETVLLDVELDVKEKFPIWAKVLLVLVLLVLLAVSGGLLFHFRHYFMSVYRVEVDSGREKVLLPFKTTVRLPEGVTVEWRHSDGRVVHINDSDLNWYHQHSQYKGRTEMKKKLKSGDFSLILKNPSRGDTGTYSCTVYDYDDWSEKILTKKEVVLNVKGRPDSLPLQTR